MTDDAPAPRKKAAPRSRKAVEAVPVDDAGTPPLDAVDVPPKGQKRSTPAKKSAAGRRRGATKPPEPSELVALREKQRLAVQLAAAGITDWDRIAELSGYADRSGAWRAVQSVLDRQEFAAVADYRRLIGFRLERLLRANWEAAISDGESATKDRAQMRTLGIIDRIVRTFGLAAEVDKIADALKIPATAEERAAELRRLRDSLRVVGGTDVGD